VPAVMVTTLRAVRAAQWYNVCIVLGKQRRAEEGYESECHSCDVSVTIWLRGIVFWVKCKPLGIVC